MDGFALAAVGAGGVPERVMTHVVQNLADGFGMLTPESLAGLVAMEEAGELTATQAKKVLAVLVESGGSPQEVSPGAGIRGYGLRRAGDSGGRAH